MRYSFPGVGSQTPAGGPGPRAVVSQDVGSWPVRVPPHHDDD